MSLCRKYYLDDDFKRRDDEDDAAFYRKPRLVQHLDIKALETVEKLTGSLITENDPVVLDLMASWDSHLPDSVVPKMLLGLGLNREELERNPRLDGALIHDLNKTPALPFGDRSFDIVLNTVSIDWN